MSWAKQSRPPLAFSASRLLRPRPTKRLRTSPVCFAASTPFSSLAATCCFFASASSTI